METLKEVRSWEDGDRLNIVNLALKFNRLPREIMQMAINADIEPRKGFWGRFCPEFASLTIGEVKEILDLSSGGNVGAVINEETGSLFDFKVDD